MTNFTVAEFWPTLTTLTFGMALRENAPSFSTINTGSGTTVGCDTVTLRPQPDKASSAIAKKRIFLLHITVLITHFRLFYYIYDILFSKKNLLVPYEDPTPPHRPTFPTASDGPPQIISCAI